MTVASFRSAKRLARIRDSLHSGGHHVKDHRRNCKSLKAPHPQRLIRQAWSRGKNISARHERPETEDKKPSYLAGFFMEECMSQSANDLQRGFSKWPVGSQELQAVAYLPPVGPNFPEGFLVLAPVGKDPELDCLAKASSPEQILEQSAELAASISRHVKEARAALTKLGWLNRGDWK
jgi:hypothetical protein